MSKFHINLHEAIYSLSDALDLVGVNHIHHGKRVAFMAAECAKALQWDSQQIDSLFQAAILHDCGVSNTAVHQKLTQFEWKLEQEHCLIGEKFLRSSPLLSHLADIVLYHHTHWNHLQALDLPESVKMNANCIYMMDRVDILALGFCEKDPNILLHRTAIQNTILEKKGTWFHPELVDMFIEISHSDSFLLSLEMEHISGYVSTWVSHDLTREINFSELKSLAQIFAYIVDAKSSYTYEHSLGVARLSRYLAEQLNRPELNCDSIEIAGLLHDIGKLRIPDAILEKSGKLTPEEYKTIQRHAIDTHMILKKIKGFETISQWASEHHERVDATGYPDCKGKKELAIEARIIAVADVFQALAQNRPYRESLSPEKILSILQAQALDGHLDKNIVLLVEENLQESWKKAISIG